MKKRLFAMVLAIATIVCAMPIVASAAVSEPVLTVLADGTNKTDVLTNTSGNFAEGGTWSYADGVLTITDAVVTTDSTGNGGIINASKFSKLTINIVGNCVFNCYDLFTAYYGSYVGDTIFTGTGTLTVNSQKWGIVQDTGEGNIVFDGASVKCNVAVMPICATNIIFKGKSVVEFKATNGYGVVASKEVIFNLSAGGSVTAVGNDGACIVQAFNTIKFENGKGMYSITTDKGANGDAVYYNNTAWLFVNADGTPATYAQIKYIGGADTSDSSDIALFGMLAVIALAGAGFAAKKKFN